MTDNSLCKALYNAQRIVSPMDSRSLLIIMQLTMPSRIYLCRILDLDLEISVVYITLHLAMC